MERPKIRDEFGRSFTDLSRLLPTDRRTWVFFQAAATRARRSDSRLRGFRNVPEPQCDGSESTQHLHCLFLCFHCPASWPFERCIVLLVRCASFEPDCPHLERHCFWSKNVRFALQSSLNCAILQQAGRLRSNPCRKAVPLGSAFALCVRSHSWPRHCLCRAFPLPLWLRHCLCLAVLRYLNMSDNTGLRLPYMAMPTRNGRTVLFMNQRVAPAMRSDHHRRSISVDVSRF